MGHGVGQVVSTLTPLYEIGQRLQGIYFETRCCLLDMASHMS